MFVLAAGLVLVFALPRAVPAKPPTGNWIEDYKAGLDKARAQNRPVLLMFSAEWCGPCNQMKKDVFNQEPVKRAISTWIPVYIDGDTKRDLMSQYKAMYYPTFVILRPDGTELGRFFGYTPADKFLMKLDVIQRQLPALGRQLTDRPRDAALWKRRARLLESIENPEVLDRVAEAFGKALSLNPGDREVAADVAFFEAAKMTEAGAPALDRRFADFIQRYPSSPRAEDALFNRIDIALREDRADEAKTLIGQYRAKYPKGKYDREIAEITEMLANPPRPEPSTPGEQPAPAPRPGTPGGGAPGDESR